MKIIFQKCKLFSLSDLKSFESAKSKWVSSGEVEVNIKHMRNIHAMAKTPLMDDSKSLVVLWLNIMRKNKYHAHMKHMNYYTSQ